jgi:hypothetical protein
MSAGSPGHIVSIIHKDTRRRFRNITTCNADSRAREIQQPTCGQTFFPNLNPVNPRARGSFDGLQQ